MNEKFVEGAEVYFKGTGRDVVRINKIARVYKTGSFILDDGTRNQWKPSGTDAVWPIGNGNKWRAVGYLITDENRADVMARYDAFHRRMAFRELLIELRELPDISVEQLEALKAVAAIS